MNKLILILRIMKAIIEVLETEIERKERHDYLEGGNEDASRSFRDFDQLRKSKDMIDTNKMKD